MILRPYQAEAVAATYAKWNAGKRRVCVVAPTGAGKTVVAEGIFERAPESRRLFLAHTQEIILQTAKRFRENFARVGVVMGQEPLDPEAPIQIATIQTLLARNFWPTADIVAQDECHHYIADDWREFEKHYEHARMFGLTATPQRGDGRPLGDLYDSLVVVAHYSQLIADGHIVQCKAYQPPEIMNRALALDPLDAWNKYADRSLTFGFANSIKSAKKYTQQFRDAGVPSATITAHTPKDERKHILSLFASGDVRVLWSVKALTEGVDVPAARCALIARSFDKAGQYMQACGRVLRAAPGKGNAIVVDLTGATLLHGLPTEDREYSLDGPGIKRTTDAPLKNCLKCGATILSAFPVCPECKFVFPKSELADVKIYSLELKAVFAGAETPAENKLREWKRVLMISASKGWSVSWAISQYRKLFSEDPDMSYVDESRQRKEWEELNRYARMKGFKRGYAAVRFRQMFGQDPPRSWRAA